MSANDERVLVLAPTGQDAGLINNVLPAGEIVRQIAREAEEVLSKRLPAFIK